MDSYGCKAKIEFAIHLDRLRGCGDGFKVCDLELHTCAMKSG